MRPASRLVVPCAGSAPCCGGGAGRRAGRRPERALRQRQRRSRNRPTGGRSKTPAGSRSPGGSSTSPTTTTAGSIASSDEQRIPVPDRRTEIATEPIDGPCGLATGRAATSTPTSGTAGVVRLLPSRTRASTRPNRPASRSTAAGNVYVDDRTYVAVYERPAAPVMDSEGEPLRIGLGTLGDGYGLAVSAAAPRSTSPTPPTTRSRSTNRRSTRRPGGDDQPTVGGFTSLVDASLAVDPTNGHLLVVDNLQPGFDHPEAAIQEFDSAGAFLGRASSKIVDGEPSGLAVDAAGQPLRHRRQRRRSPRLRVRPLRASGLVDRVGGIRGAAGRGRRCAGGAATRLRRAARLRRPPRAASARATGATRAAASEVVQRGRLRVAFKAALRAAPLPRHGAAPVHFSLGTKIASPTAATPPQLRRIAIAINRNGHLDPTGLPVCRIDEIQPSTTEARSPPAAARWSAKGSFSRQGRCSPSRRPSPPRARSSPSTAACTGARRSSPTSTAPSPSPPPTPCPS